MVTGFLLSSSGVKLSEQEGKLNQVLQETKKVNELPPFEEIFL